MYNLDLASLLIAVLYFRPIKFYINIEISENTIGAPKNKQRLIYSPIIQFFHPLKHEILTLLIINATINPPFKNSIELQKQKIYRKKNIFTYIYIHLDM